MQYNNCQRLTQEQQNALFAKTMQDIQTQFDDMHKKLEKLNNDKEFQENLKDSFNKLSSEEKEERLNFLKETSQAMALESIPEQTKRLIEINIQYAHLFNNIKQEESESCNNIFDIKQVSEEEKKEREEFNTYINKKYHDLFNSNKERELIDDNKEAEYITEDVINNIKNEFAPIQKVAEAFLNDSDIDALDIDQKVKEGCKTMSLEEKKILINMAQDMKEALALTSFPEQQKRLFELEARYNNLHNKKNNNE